MSTKSKYPAMPFDTRDWLCCPELKVLAPDVRGLWMDMLCYMWESPEKGVMVNPSGKPYTQAEIVALIGLDSQGSTAWLSKLIQAGVCGVREDGAIISRRMVREHVLSQKRAAAGRKGGKATSCRADGLKPQERAKNAKKKAYAEYVHLSEAEYGKLVQEYGQEQTDWMIRKLDNTKGSNTKKYQYTSDYRAILNWVVGAYNEQMKNGTNDKLRDAGSSSEDSSRYSIGTTL